MAVNKVEICGVNTSKLPLLREEEKQKLFLQIQQGDKEAKEEYIKGNLRLVLSVMKRFYTADENPDDLFQIGCVGLIKAINNFNPEMEVKFSTYAVPMIAGEIRRFLRDDGIVKVSRTLKENSWKIRRESDLFRQRKGREPTVNELQECTGMTPEEIVQAMDFSVEVDSIDRTVRQSDGSEISLLDRLQVENTRTEELLNRVMLEQLLAELPEKERRLIIMRYLQDRSQTEVARMMGVSQVQVSRLEKKILKQMRERLTGE